MEPYQCQFVGKSFVNFMTNDGNPPPWTGFLSRVPNVGELVSIESSEGEESLNFEKYLVLSICTEIHTRRKDDNACWYNILVQKVDTNETDLEEAYKRLGEVETELRSKSKEK
jgi:hypothetical protein